MNLKEMFAIAWRYHQSADFRQAEQLYRQIVQADPFNSDVWCFLGATCQDQGRLAEAETHFRRALEILPTHPSALNCLGIVVAQQGRRDEASNVFEEALRNQPDDAEVHNNLGLVREKQQRTDDAVIHYRRALELRPGFPDAHNNLANVLADEGKLRESLEHYDESIRHRPGFAVTHFNRATPRLLLEDFAGGWSDYEFRWRQAGFVLPKYAQPRWDGAALPGKTILLWAEQGLGDTIQFIRYVPLVKQRAHRVILACQPALMRLLKDFPDVDEIVSKEASPPTFDVWAMLLSLPGLMGTTLASIPTQVPYLSADPELIRHWRQELGPFSGFKIGIAWQGNPTYRKDAQRSFSLTCLEPLSKLPGVQLVSLQKGPAAEQLQDAAKDWHVVDLRGKLDEGSGPFRDTAAIMSVLDLVITSDSAVAHLAGALGVPVWVALPRMPDWRWLLNRQDSPWYPTMRLFRQTRDGQWDDVFANIVEEAKTLLSRRLSAVKN